MFRLLHHWSRAFPAEMQAWDCFTTKRWRGLLRKIWHTGTIEDNVKTGMDKIEDNMMLLMFNITHKFNNV